MRALFDISVLVARLDGAHVSHPRAWNGLAQQADKAWASCPLTQNGVVRIMSQPAYPGGKRVVDVAHRLQLACADAEHQFWTDDVSLLCTGLIDWSHIQGHRQVTDAYLLALAVRHGGRFVTLDQRVSVQMVPQAQRRHLEVIA